MSEKNEVVSLLSDCQETLSKIGTSHELGRTISNLLERLEEKLSNLEKENIANENERMKKALEYIQHLWWDQKGPHLGRPRKGDNSCIFCMAEFAKDPSNVPEKFFGDLLNEVKPDEKEADTDE